MKTWNVYRHDVGEPRLRSLGTVKAKGLQHKALDAAWKKWPKEIDGSQVAMGFVVRPQDADVYAEKII